MTTHRNALTAAAFALAASAAAAQLAYPVAPRAPVTDEYFGTRVTDDYRWMEDRRSPELGPWSAAENEVTRKYLDALPQREGLLKRLRELLGSEPVRYADFQQRKVLFAMKRQPPSNQPYLVVMEKPGDTSTERVLVDPNKVDAKGTTAIDFFVPSLDGKYVALGMSEGGSEDGAARVIDVATGKMLDDVVPRVMYPTGGGSIAWNRDATGFFYTRYPQGSERAPEDANFYQQVYFHKLGTPASTDTYEVGNDFPRIAEIELDSSRDGRFVLARVANGDGGEHAYYLRAPNGRWSKVAGYEDKVQNAEIGRDNRLYLLSLKDAPRGKVLAVRLMMPRIEEAKLVVPEGEATILAINPTRRHLYVTYMAGGPTELRVFDTAGKHQGTVPTEPVSSVGVAGVLDNGDVLVKTQSYLSAPAVLLYSAKEGKLSKTHLAGEPAVTFKDARVLREMATSKDGTKVPVNILMKKGTKLDGSNPLLLYGYGGYGISMEPRFSLAQRAWLDHGGVFVVANLRGGGEFGEEWHLAGNLLKKQNVFDDMIGAAEHLIARGYTRKERLAVMGGSNGGLLMGAILTQRPELFRAVVSQVGVYDMLRVETTPNGAFNVTEYGTVKDRAQFEALYAYSPYHRVKDGTAYPAVLLTAGENDGRVDPFHSRKMAARLQVATTSGKPVLLRVSGSTGHGIGTSLGTRIEEIADSYAFLMDQLGMK